MVTKKKKMNTKQKPSSQKKKTRPKPKTKSVTTVVTEIMPTDELPKNEFFEKLGVEADESGTPPVLEPVKMDDDNEEVPDLTPWQRFIKFLKEFV